MVKSDTWFFSVNNAGRNTRSTVDPLNLRIQPARQGVRRHFFSNRVVEDWNRIPSWLKSAKQVKISKMATLISEQKWLKTRKMQQAVSRSSVWTTPSRRHSLRGSRWATASQPASTSTSIHSARVSPGIDSGPAVSVQKGGGGGARQRHQAVKQTLSSVLSVRKMADPKQ
jgi:hypothetical protein